MNIIVNEIKDLILFYIIAASLQLKFENTPLELCVTVYIVNMTVAFNILTFKLKKKLI